MLVIVQSDIVLSQIAALAIGHVEGPDLVSLFFFRADSEVYASAVNIIYHLRSVAALAVGDVRYIVIYGLSDDILVLKDDPLISGEIIPISLFYYFYVDFYFL